MGYEFVRDHMTATGKMDFVPFREEIQANYEPGSSQEVTLHDGSVLQLYKNGDGQHYQDRHQAINAIQASRERGEVLTGLLFIDPSNCEFHDTLGTVKRPLRDLDERDLCPGSRSLEAINASLR